MPLSAALAAIREVAVAALRPYGVQRISVIGVARGDSAGPADPSALLQDDIHLLVEFAPGAAPLELTTWLRVQREISEATGGRIELVTVGGLLGRVAGEDVALTVLYDVTPSEAGGAEDG